MPAQPPAVNDDQDKAIPHGISFPRKEWEAIDARVKELRLGKRGRSKYFQMLREYDKHAGLQKSYHAADGDVHFFPAPESLLYAAESPADAIQRAMEATPPHSSTTPHTAAPTPPKAPAKPPADK